MTPTIAPTPQITTNPTRQQYAGASATDVSLLLDGSGSMLCRSPSCTNIPTFKKTDVNQTVVINNGALTFNGGRFPSIFWKNNVAHPDGTATIKTVEEKVDGNVTLSDGSEFLNPHDFYHNWNMEKLAAVQLVDALAEKKSTLTVGMVQFSIDAKVEAAQSPESDLASVKKLIQAAELRSGGTDFGSPLALCYDELSKAPAYTGPSWMPSTKFCVLITDGVPDESAQTQTMHDFCMKRNLPLTECTTRNVMYSIKQAGYTIV